jgi:hypothetical protein
LESVVKEIYGQQTAFMKAPVDDSMSVPPGGIFSFRNKQQHSQRRRLLSHAFSQANISHTERLIREHIKCFVDLMDQKLGVPVDVFTTFRTLSFDIVGEYHGILLACGLVRDTTISPQSFYPGELFLGQKFHGRREWSGLRVEVVLYIVTQMHTRLPSRRTKQRTLP